MSKVLLFKQLPDYLREAITSGVTRTICPQCEGGSKSEMSLSIRQAEDDVVLKLSCWRSTCDWYAYTVTDKDAVIETRNVKRASIYRQPTIPLQGDILGKLKNDYGLIRGICENHGWRMDEHGTCLVMPIECPSGGVRGHITRTFGEVKTCYTYKATAQPWLDHWPADAGRDVVVVEDTLSACRLAGLGYHAVALLGTSISVPQAQEIASIACDGNGSKNRTVFLALDQDATAKAMKLARRHAHIVNMLPVCLTEDIKNMEHDADIHKLFTYG